jgi:hypothetical protein
MFEVQSPWDILVALFRGTAWLLNRMNARKQTCSSAFPLVVDVPQRASIALANTRVGRDPRRQRLATACRGMRYGGMVLIAYKQDVAQDPVYFNYPQHLVSLRLRTSGKLDGVEGARSVRTLPDLKFSDEGHVVTRASAQILLLLPLVNLFFGSYVRFEPEEALDFCVAQ